MPEALVQIEIQTDKPTELAMSSNIKMDEMGNLASSRIAAFVILAFLAGFSSVTSCTFAFGSDDITAVSSKTSDDYIRTRMANGKFQSESYAFGQGGFWNAPIKDESIDKLKFTDVAEVIAAPLAEQNYIPAKDPAKTKLLIMVYWGMTDVPPPIAESHAYQDLQLAQQGVIPMDFALTEVAIENQKRDRTDFKNAAMLGYDREGLIGTEYGSAMATGWMKLHKDELTTEIEDNRYFVVLMAYDFQLLWKQKKHKLLWETRFSIRETHHSFDKDLPEMARFASHFFGQDSGALIHNPIPLGQVKIGEVKSLGEVPEKPPTDKVQLPSKP